DIDLGDIKVHVPSARGAFQADFDFTAQKGFVLRVSAGVDIQSGVATWLLQAIDPETGEVIQDPARGLLPPTDARGGGEGFVSYTIRPRTDVTTGTVITSQARVLFNTAPPEDTLPITTTVDAVAPRTDLTVTPLAGGADYALRWTSADDEGGSGV